MKKTNRIISIIISLLLIWVYSSYTIPAKGKPIQTSSKTQKNSGQEPKKLQLLKKLPCLKIMIQKIILSSMP